MHIFVSSYWLLPHCLCQLISVFIQFHAIFRLQGCAGELTMVWVGGGVSGEQRPRSEAFAEFHGINTPAAADLKLSRPCHRMWIWKRCTAAHDMAFRLQRYETNYLRHG